MLGTPLTTGCQTISNILRTVYSCAKGHFSSYHWMFSLLRWSAWVLARLLIAFLLDHVVQPGPVLLACDDTVADHLGPHVFGKGRYRDGMRSTYSDTAYRWGIRGSETRMERVRMPLGTHASPHGTIFATIIISTVEAWHLFSAEP
jgi:hypothetical protein